MRAQIVDAARVMSHGPSCADHADETDANRMPPHRNIFMVFSIPLFLFRGIHHAAEAQGGGAFPARGHEQQLAVGV